MMELQWGGGVRRERRVSMFFAKKLPVLFASAIRIRVRGKQQ